MRVLHVISGLRATAGGTVTALAALAAAQRSAGADVSVVASFVRPEADDAEALRARGLTVHQIGPCRDPFSRHPDIAPRLSQLAREHDVIHIHGLWEEIQHQAAKQGRRLGMPYIFSPHGMLDPWSLAQGALKKKLYLALRLRRDLNGAAAIHFTTTVERDLVAPLRLAPPAIVEPNGVDLSEFDPPPARGTLRSRYQQLAGRPIVIALGRVHRKKGFDLLIPAFARLPQDDVMLVIAGPDDEQGYRAQVEEMIERHQLRDRVLFTGMLRGRERIEALADADLFVLPSYQENFGIAVIESLAAGTPVVISDQVNIHPEISAAGVGGVAPTQVEPLAREMARWLGDESLRREAARRAGPFVRERYDWNRIARRWLGHYARFAAQARDREP